MGGDRGCGLGGPAYDGRMTAAVCCLGAQAGRVLERKEEEDIRNGSGKPAGPAGGRVASRGEGGGAGVDGAERRFAAKRWPKRRAASAATEKRWRGDGASKMDSGGGWGRAARRACLAAKGQWVASGMRLAAPAPKLAHGEWGALEACSVRQTCSRECGWVPEKEQCERAWVEPVIGRVQQGRSGMSTRYSEPGKVWGWSVGWLALVGAPVQCLGLPSSNRQGVAPRRGSAAPAWGPLEAPAALRH